MATNDGNKPTSVIAQYLERMAKGQPPLETESEQEPEQGQEQKRVPPEAEAEAEVIQFPSSKKHLDPSTNIETLQLPLVRFPGVKLVIPEQELVHNGWTEFIAEVAPYETTCRHANDTVEHRQR